MSVSRLKTKLFMNIVFKQSRPPINNKRKLRIADDDCFISSSLVRNPTDNVREKCPEEQKGTLVVIIEPQQNQRDKSLFS